MSGGWGDVGKGALSGAATGAAFGPWGAAIGGVIGGLGGWLSGGDDEEEAAQAEAQRQREEALRRWEGVRRRAPLQEELDAGVDQGYIDELRGGSMATGAQERTLTSLDNIANSGGLDAQALNRIAMARSQAQMEAGAQEDAIQQQMSARGMGGSGMELAGRLGAQQGAAQAGYLAGNQAASDASDRALQAMITRGQMGTAMRGQDVAEAQARLAGQQYNSRARADAYQQGFQNDVTTTSALNGQANMNASNTQQIGAENAARTAAQTDAATDALGRIAASASTWGSGSGSTDNSYVVDENGNKVHK